jgi:hypothetical protein
MRNAATVLPAYGVSLLGVSLLSLPVWDGAAINFPTVVLNTTAGSYWGWSSACGQITGNT